MFSLEYLSNASLQRGRRFLFGLGSPITGATDPSAINAWETKWPCAQPVDVIDEPRKVPHLPKQSSEDNPVVAGFYSAKMRRGRQSQGRQAGLHSQSLDQKPQPIQGRCRNEALGRPGVIADNRINLGRALEKQSVP